jgi:hypothetical protein
MLISWQVLEVSCFSGGLILIATMHWFVTQTNPGMSGHIANWPKVEMGRCGHRLGQNADLSDQSQGFKIIK